MEQDNKYQTDLIDLVTRESGGVPLGLTILKSIAALRWDDKLMEVMSRGALHEHCDEQVSHDTWLPLYDDLTFMVSGFNSSPFVSPPGISALIKESHELKAKSQQLIQRVKDRTIDYESAMRETIQIKAAMDELQKEVAKSGSQQMDFFKSFTPKKLKKHLNAANLKETLQVVKDPKMQFILRVFIPCTLHFGTSPQHLLKRALEGDAESLERLVTLDKAVLQHPKLSEFFHECVSTGDTLMSEAVSRGMKKQLKALDARTAKLRIAGIVTLISQKLGQDVSNPVLRQIFDAAAKVDGELHDSDMPMTDDEMRVYMNRFRKKYGDGWGL